MEISPDKKIEFFKNELDLIFDLKIREFTVLAIQAAPDYFFTDCPASSSGKYHPIDELSWDGTIIHTRKVFSVAYDLCNGLACSDSRDLVLSASLIHDLRKRGVTEGRHTVKYHPQLAADLVQEVHSCTNIIPDEQAEIIRNCCGYHYGPWSINPWKKPLEKYTPEELCVYLSDYFASRKANTVNYKNREW